MLDCCGHMRVVRLVAFVLVGLTAVDRPAPAAELDEPMARVARFDPGGGATYFLHVPDGPPPPGGWPLFIAVHGAMSSGKGDFKLWRPYADQEGFVLMAPNFQGAYYQFKGREDRLLLRMVEEVGTDIPIHRDKVLLSGFSRGGEFAYRMAMTFPEFAQTLVVFNASELPDPGLAGRSNPARVYFAVGSEEPGAAQDRRRLVELLKRSGYDAELTVARGVGHSIPSAAIADVLRLLREMRAAR